LGFLALGRVANELEEREQTTNHQMAQKPPQISQLESLADATSHELKNILEDIHE
jgi:hypothetical protein